ncbi:TetR family transcriptional regulator [Dactylosporangium sp. CA-092794]
MRREIRDAAAQLFQQRGIRAVSLKDVAAEVGQNSAS